MSDTQSQTPEVTQNQEWEAKADRLYTYIHDYLKEHAISPSHKEMYQYLRCSPNTLAMLLNHLDKTRPIQRIRGRARRLWIPISEMPEED